MVRNFNMVKFRPCLPMRFCRKRTGPADVSLTARPTANKIGMSTGIMAKTQAQSKTRFAPDRHQELRGFPNTRNEESEFGRNLWSGCNKCMESRAPSAPRLADCRIFVESGLLETYDSVLTMNLHRTTCRSASRPVKWNRCC
jgi:hypothetical protein